MGAESSLLEHLGGVGVRATSAEWTVVAERAPRVLLWRSGGLGDSSRCDKSCLKAGAKASCGRATAHSGPDSTPVKPAALGR